jgi:small subunit ribosomal protein S15
MALYTVEKEKIVGSHRIHDTDTGSPEVQIGLLTARIQRLTIHFKSHGKDHHSYRGLKKMVEQRRRLLRYAQRKDQGRYKAILKANNLRK